MVVGMRNLAIIPARSGSKGLKDKNIRLLNGIPLIDYSIKAAINSGVFKEIMVSTDSGKYAAIAKECGASVPFLRSGINSEDSSSSWDVVAEILANYKSLGMEFDTFCLLQPTSPLRTANDIIKAYRKYEEKRAVSVVAVCECEHSPLLCNTLDESGSLNQFMCAEKLAPRQALDTFYRINGALYIMNVREFQRDRFIYREGSYAYVMERSRSIDIDNELDFQFADFLCKKDSKI